MKRFMTTRSLGPLALLLAVGASVLAEHHEHGEKPGWFDPAHCDVCRPMHERPDLMQAMKWESHKVANGMMMTTTIPADKKADFYAVCESMHSHTPQAGDQLCGFCVGYGDLLKSGAKMEEVKTDFGMITLVTSDDDATVAKIHAVADRSNAEMKKLLQMEAAH